MSDATFIDNAAVGTQLAQAATDPIGSVVSSNGDITITRVTGETVSGVQGTPIFADDNVVTGPGASVGFEFVDFSTFSLGESAEIILDELVYDPGADSSMVVNLVAGTFSFVSGEIAKSGDDSMQIVTPVATIGVRGTAGAGDPNSAVLLEENGEEVGELSFRTQAGEEVLTEPNDYTRADSPFDVPDEKTTLPLDQVQSQFGSALRELPTTLPANENIRRPGAGNNNQNDGSDEDGGGAGEQGTGEDGAESEGEGEEGEEGEGEEAAEGEGEEVAEEDLEEDEELTEEELAEEDGLAEEGELGEGEEGLDGEEVAEGEAPGEGEPGEGEDGLDGEGVAEGEAPGEGEGQEGDVQEASLDGGLEGDGGFGGDGGLFGSGSDGGLDGGFGDDGLGGDGFGDDGLGGDGFGDEGDDLLGLGGDDPFGLGGDDPFGDDPFADDPFADDPFAEDPFAEEDPDDPIVEEEPPPEEGGGGGAVDFVTSSTFTLTTGAADTVNLAAASINVDLLGTAEIIDTFTDTVPGGGAQSINFIDDAPHDVFVNGIEAVSFGALTNTATVTVQGTDGVTVDGAGAFVVDLFGDGSDNNVTLDGGQAGSVSSDVNLGGGNDTLVLLDGTSKTVSVLSTETVQTGNTSHDVTFGDAGTLDSTAGTGAQNLTLLAGVSVVWQGQNANVGSATFSGGNETLSFEFQVSGGLFDGQGGTDTLDFSNGQASVINIQNVENFVGGVGDDTVESNSFLQSGSIFDGAGGSDLLTIQGGTNTFSVTNFEQVASVGGVTDNITLENNVSNVTFSLSGGAVDTINLFGAGANDLSVQTTEAVIGGAGDDTVTALDQIGTVNLGGGTDTFILDGGITITSNLTGVEFINGQVGTSESLTLNSDLVGATVNLGVTAGDDLILNGVGTNSATIIDINSVLGAAGSETITFNGSGAATVDLGGSVDTVIVTSGLVNFGAMSNVENYVGGSGNDTVSLSLGLVSGDDYDGGLGTDVLNLEGVTTHAGAITQFETVNLAVAGSSLTLETANTENIQFNFTTGTSTLNLANGTNLVTFNADLASTANIVGGTGDDTVNMAGGFNAGTVNLGSGTDTADASTSVGVVQTTFTDVENFVGSAGDDTVKVSNALGIGDVFDGGANSAGDTLELLAGVAHVGTITEFEFVKVTVANTSIVLETNDTGNQEFIFTTGSNSLTLSSGVNIVSVNNSADASLSVTGNSNDDTVNLTASVNGAVINLSTGVDTVDASASGGVASTSLQGVNNFVGSGAADSIFVTDSLVSGSNYDGGLGFDVVDLQNANNNGSFTSFEEVRMTVASSTLTLESATNENLAFSFTSGTNALTLASGINSITVDAEQGFGTIGVFGGTGDDTVTLLGSHIGSNFSLGLGNDTVQMEQGGFTSASFTDVETVLGTVPGIENLTVENQQNGTVFDLGVSGGDNVTFTSAANNTATFANVHQVISSSGDDNFTFTGTGVIDIQMGGGTDTLTIGSGQATFFAGISDVEILTGSAFDDTVFVDTQLTAGSVFDGQGGTNLLRLNGLVNQGAIFQFDTVEVTSTSAVVTLEAADNSNTVFSFTGGTNTLNLSLGANVVTFDSQAVGNTDTINGSASDDFVNITGDFLGGSIDLASTGGTNTVNASGAVKIDTFMSNVNAFTGSTNDDNIVMGTALVSGDVFDGGGSAGPGDVLELFGAINTGTIKNFSTINVAAQNATVTLEADDVTNQQFVFTIGGNTLNLQAGDHIVTVDSSAVGSSSTVILGNASVQNVTTTGSITTVFDLGDGVDTMTASTSASDIFFFDNISESLVATPDVINNFDAFDPTEDIDFSGFAFSSFSFIGTGNFQANGTVEARFDDATDTLQVDTNDDGATDMAIVLNGVNAADLDAGDFTV